jgi:hypothetical protein
LGRSHPNQQKEQQLFELPSAEIKLIVLQSSAGDVGLEAYHKPLLYELAVFGYTAAAAKSLQADHLLQDLSVCHILGGGGYLISEDLAFVLEW